MTNFITHRQCWVHLSLWLPTYKLIKRNTRSSLILHLWNEWVSRCRNLSLMFLRHNFNLANLVLHLAFAAKERRRDTWLPHINVLEESFWWLLIEHLDILMAVLREGRRLLWWLELGERIILLIIINLVVTAGTLTTRPHWHKLGICCIWLILKLLCLLDRQIFEFLFWHDWPTLILLWITISLILEVVLSLARQTTTLEILVAKHCIIRGSTRWQIRWMRVFRNKRFNLLNIGSLNERLMRLHKMLWLLWLLWLLNHFILTVWWCNFIHRQLNLRLHLPISRLRHLRLN